MYTLKCRGVHPLTYCMFHVNVICLSPFCCPLFFIVRLYQREPNPLSNYLCFHLGPFFFLSFNLSFQPLSSLFSPWLLCASGLTPSPASPPTLKPPPPHHPVYTLYPLISQTSPVIVIPCIAAAGGTEARRDSLFCPDELDSLFSYFDTSSKLRSSKYWKLSVPLAFHPLCPSNPLLCGCRLISLYPLLLSFLIHFFLTNHLIITERTMFCWRVGFCLSLMVLVGVWFMEFCTCAIVFLFCFVCF